MNAKTLNVVKTVVAVATFGLTLVSSYLAGKELDNKVAEKVAEAFENK